MFKTLLTDKLMLAWVGIPAFIAFAIFFMQCKSAKPEEKKYKAETFRNPINTAVTVSGLIIPLVCASISYLANQSVSPRELIPLIACLILLTMAILVGLYNLFSMTECEQDEIIVSQKSFTYFIPAFVLQLSLLVGGILVLIVYFLFSFNLGATNSKTAVVTQAYIGRPLLRVGMPVEQISATWGIPENQEAGTNKQTWKYSGQESEFLITIRDAKIWSIEERKK